MSLSFKSKRAEGKPDLLVVYELADGRAGLVVRSTYTNPHDKPVTFDLVDRIRADRTFEHAIDNSLNTAWWYDKWFGQAYAIVPQGRKVEPIKPPPMQTDKEKKRGGTSIQYTEQGKGEVTLEPGKSITLVREIIAGRDLFAVKAVAADLAGTKLVSIGFKLRDKAGPVRGAHIAIARGKIPYAWGRTDSRGFLTVRVPPGNYACSESHFAREESTGDFNIDGDTIVSSTRDEPGYVAAQITDEKGEPVPCKVQFRDVNFKLSEADAKKSGSDQPTRPDFGPDSGIRAVKNLYYSQNGRFRQPLKPGTYDVLISHGPEYDVESQKIEIKAGERTPLRAKLVRTVQTPGWVSTDFHSHSSPSGDNTSHQRGRVLNLLAEHVEFAPCTEHNRVDSYTPHLRQLKAEHLMATCTGIELTGQLLPANHQNAFPLLHKPRTQDGGGPVIDANPLKQIERLALWDNKSEKLIQMNHPNLIRVLGDRDNDGKPDEGFEKMFGWVDVMEVHPPQAIFKTPPATLAEAQDEKKELNTIFHWMQMLNLGYRVPGVVNTDAHYNFHGSGFLRNYVKSPSDDPAEIDTLEMVRESAAGHVIMSSGPFMEVKLTAAMAGDKSSGTAGDEVRVPGGKAELHVLVQCPNWLDIDRVQIFVNGRPDEKLNFTRRTTPDRFGSSVVKFDQRIPLELAKDAHLIVAAIGESSTLGIVMGPDYGKHKPVAVANPIFVDVDGNGFTANGDLMGVALPHQPQPTKRIKQ